MTAFKEDLRAGISIATQTATEYMHEAEYYDRLGNKVMQADRLRKAQQIMKRIEWYKERLSWYE